MKVYFDKANILSFLESSAIDSKKYEACNSMLRNHFEIHLNMLIDDFSSEPLLMDWLKTLMDDGVDVPQCINSIDDSFPAADSLKGRASFEDELKKIEDGFSTVFCLDSSEAGILSDFGNFLITDVGGELETLYSLRFEDDDPYTLELNARKDFNNPQLWNPIENLSLPCSDIIIIDSYILCNDLLYEKNIRKLISALASKVFASNLNIVIFSLEKPYYANTKMAHKANFEPDWNLIRKNIQNDLSSVGISASVSFVCPATTPDFGEHPRTILTNYRSYNPDATLNFYDCNGKYSSTGRYVYAKSLAKTSHLITSKEVIESLQELINDIKAGKRNGSLHTDPADKLSNYFTF